MHPERTLALIENDHVGDTLNAQVAPRGEKADLR